MNENFIYQDLREQHMIIAARYETDALRENNPVRSAWGWDSASYHWDKAGLPLNARACRIAAGQ